MLSVVGCPEAQAIIQREKILHLVSRVGAAAGVAREGLRPGPFRWTEKPAALEFLGEFGGERAQFPAAAVIDRWRSLTGIPRPPLPPDLDAGEEQPQSA